MKKLSFVSLFLLLIPFAHAQQITLHDCLEWARTNHPKTSEKVLLDESLLIRVEQLKKSLRPSVNLYAQTTYQSDVTSIDLQIPNVDLDISSPDLFQYKAYAEVTQTVYDGGRTKSRMDIEKVETAIEKQNVEVSLYQLNQKVILTYFSVLLYQQQKEQLQLIKEQLASNYQKVGAMVEYGAGLASDTMLMKVEMIRIQSQIDQVRHKKEAAFQILSELTGKTFKASRRLSLSNYDLSQSVAFDARPEIQLVDLQMKKLDQSIHFSEKNDRPQIMAFGNVGYGDPALNMFETDGEAYYLVGAKMSWNIWNWKQSEDERKRLSIRKQVLKQEKESIIQNFSTDLIARKSTILELKEVLISDAEMMKLYDKIVDTYASKLENGTITSAQYIEQLNNKKLARVNYEYHMIQHAKAIVEYNLILGNINKRNNESR